MSASSFWDMGGYATYVWGSYGAAAAVFVWNLVAAALRRRAVLRQLRDSGEPS